MVKHEDEELGFLADVGDIDSLLSDSDEEEESDDDAVDYVMVNGIKVPLAHGEMVLGSKDSKLRDGVNDVKALSRHVENIAYKVPKGLKRVPWVETLAITAQRTVDDVAATDDIKREGIFQALTLDSTREGLRRLTALNVPFSRPADYFADMAKTDSHMKKIQGKLEEEQRRMAAVEDRKKNKLEKKFAKEKRVESQLQKKKAAKETIKELDEWKKNREKDTTGLSSKTVEEDLDTFFEQKDRAKADRDFKAMTQKKKQLSSLKHVRKDDDFKNKVKIGGGTGREVFGTVGKKKFEKPGRDAGKFSISRKAKRKGASVPRGKNGNPKGKGKAGAGGKGKGGPGGKGGKGGKPGKR